MARGGFFGANLSGIFPSSAPWCTVLDIVFASLASAGQMVRQVTAAYGHFGRKPYTENGMKFFEWENPVDLSKCPHADFSQ